MNVTGRLTPDFGLDGVIEALDHVIPVFNADRLDLGVRTRYCWSLAGFLSHLAQEIALTTQNTRRKQIIPGTPKLLILKDTALKAAGEIDSQQRQEWASENVNANRRRSLVGIAHRQIGELMNAITRLESHWGSFHVWITRPKRALCESLIRAWQKGELDSEDFLVWFRKYELGLLGPQLDPYVAEVLLGLRVSGGEILLPGDLRNLAHLNDDEIYTAILRQARGRRLADGDPRQDRVRLTVGHDPAGKKIRRYAHSLDAGDENGMTLKDRLPDITRDPIEFLCSSRQPVKLADLAAMRDELAGDERWSRLNLTLDEHRYLRLDHGCGMTQEEAGEYLQWDASRIQAVRRNADPKVKKYRETGTASEAKN